VNKRIYKIVLFLEKYVIYVALKVLQFTVTYDVKGLGKPYPRGIYVFWHRDIIPMLINRRHEDVVVIVSPSKDGDYAAEPAKLFGYIPVRGSTSRQGTSALKEMIKLSDNHSLAITPDGPKGPARKLKEGALQLAYLTKLPIYAIRVSISKEVIINSWDKFRIPLPCAKIEINYSEAFWVKTKEDFDVRKIEIEKFMNF